MRRVTSAATHAECGEWENYGVWHVWKGMGAVTHGESVDCVRLTEGERTRQYQCKVGKYEEQ